MSEAAGIPTTRAPGTDDASSLDPKEALTALGMVTRHLLVKLIQPRTTDTYTAVLADPQRFEHVMGLYIEGVRWDDTAHKHVLVHDGRITRAVLELVRKDAMLPPGM